MTLAERWGLELISPAEDLLLQLPRSWTRRQISARYLEDIGPDELPLFVKPLEIGLFPSRVCVSPGSIEDLCGGLPPTTCLQVAEVVQFEAEARTFVLGQRVLDCSIYHGSTSLEDVRAFTESFLASARGLPPALVLDVGLIRGAGWAIVEANPVWASALRGCTAARVLPSIAAASSCPT